MIVRSVHVNRTRGLSRAFTLMEALVAAVVVALVAAAAAVAVSVGVATQEDGRMAVLAMHAAELQMSSCMEASYDTMDSLAGQEDTGQMLAPARPGSTTRPLLPSSFSQLRRVTTITASTKTFSQYGNITVEGKQVVVSVFGPGNTLLAQLTRYRSKETSS